MPEVRIGSEIKTYPQGTAYAEIAEEYQKNYENDILLVSVNGRLRELHKTLQKDCLENFIFYVHSDSFPSFTFKYSNFLRLPRHVTTNLCSHTITIYDPI